MPWILWSAAGGGKRRAAALYVGVLLFWALAALAVSLYLDPQFISYYRSFADTAGVSTGLFERFARFREFFQKMACGHAGTYYLAPIAPQLWALPLVSALALISSRRSAAMVGTASLGMTLLAIFVIGKNSPPSIVFLFPWLYLISGVLFSRIYPKGLTGPGKLRPVWNEVYGNPHRFYPDLLLLLERFGTQEARFEGGPYAMRLIQFLDRGPFHLEIYRIKLP